MTGQSESQTRRRIGLPPLQAHEFETKGTKGNPQSPIVNRQSSIVNPVGSSSDPPPDPYVHPQALCESTCVGPGTQIWPFAHVMAGAIVGADCNICGYAFIESGAVLGDQVTVKNGAMIWDGVTIADDVFIGPGVIFTNDLYPRSTRAVQSRDRKGAGRLERVATDKSGPVTTTIEAGASIGAGAVIICGVTIGSRAMIAAGAVVTHNVPPHSLCVGNPARLAGWVCACGKPLDDQLQCRTCRRAYTIARGVVTPQ
ncbi:MAG: acyltransferase [Phycisphaerae bacterium]